VPDQPAAGLVFALALGAGVFAQLVARHLRVPSIVVLLATGVALGADGLGWVEPRALGTGLLDLVSIAVAVILFEGALNLDLARLRHAQAAIRRLVTIGAGVTALGAAAAAHWIMGWEWRLAIVFGTLVIVTGPTVIRPLLRNVPLRRRLATTLEAEGVLIDPIGAIVAAVALEVVLVPTAGAAAAFGAPELVARLFLGALAGLVFGFLLGLLLRRPRIVPEGMENLVALGAALILFEACNELLSESGLLAVTVAGVVVGNMKPHVVRELQEFEEHLTVGLLGILFVLLAADVRLADVGDLGWAGAATVAVLMLVVRPVNVFLSTSSSELDLREKLFLSWTGPRGIVAAAVASLAAVLLEGGGAGGAAEAGALGGAAGSVAASVGGGGAADGLGIADGAEAGAQLRALVFLTIAATVVLQGGTATWVARWLRVRAPGRDAVAILGAEDLALTLGETLRRGGVAVTFLDANPTHCRRAEERDFPVVFGNALDERVLVRARLERCRAAVGLTANDEVNSLFAREAREDFDVPETYVAVGRGTTVTSRILRKQSSRTLFDGPKDVERWNVRLRHGQVRLERYRFAGRPEGASEEPQAAVDPFVLLALERDEVRVPMHSELEPREGDVAVVALYEAEAANGRRLLEERGWQREGPEPPAEDESAAGEEEPTSYGAGASSRSS